MKALVWGDITASHYADFLRWAGHEVIYYPTPTLAQLQAAIQDPEVSIVVAGAHGDSFFMVITPSLSVTASDVRNWMQNRVPMRVAIMMSCEAMEHTDMIGVNWTSSFTKGDLSNSVVAGGSTPAGDSFGSAYMRKYLILGETMTQAHQNGIQEYQQTQQSEPNYDPDFASHFILVGNGDLVLSDKPQQPVATFGLGKGLSEPCSPYRQAMFFGASLFSNDQLLSEVSGWNCAPDMVGPVADIVHTPPALTLYFTNPVSRQDANRNDPVTTHWSVNMYDPVMHSWEGGEIVPLSDPIILHPRSNTFLLVIYEWYGPYSYGPYLITIPEFGTYTFDGKAKTINGQPVTDMTAVANQSDFYGTLISTTGDEPPPRYWNATIRVNDSVQVGGENWGRFFIGDTIEILLGAPEMTAIEVGPNGEYHISAVLVRALWGRWRWVWSFYAQGYSGP